MTKTSLGSKEIPQFRFEKFLLKSNEKNEVLFSADFLLATFDSFYEPVIKFGKLWYFFE